MTAPQSRFDKLHLSIFDQQLSGEAALAEAVEIYQSDHWFCYQNFAKTALYVAERLRKIGLADVRLESYPADNTTRYSGWNTLQAWDVTRAKLRLMTPIPRVLADWSVLPHNLIMRSSSAHGTFPLVRWNGDESVDLTGLIAFTHLRPAEVQHSVRALGGKGILSDFVPTIEGVRNRQESREAVLWEQICFRPNPHCMWGFMINPRVGEWLDDQLSRGELMGEVDIQARNYDGIIHSVDAVLPANEAGSEQLLLLAHLYEPGANDNASGVGLAIEILRTLRELQTQGKISLRRSIRVLFAYEGRGSVAWMHRHANELPNLIAGLNLDEIGIEQSQGKSIAHLFLPPHSLPSAVGDLLVHLAESMLPTWIKWKAVADRADIILDARFSDPVVGVPTPSIIQYPAAPYHTSLDTPDKLSAEVLHAFGVLSCGYLATLGSLSSLDSSELDEILSRRARAELSFIAGETAQAHFRERLAFKQEEMSRYGISQLPQLQSILESLPMVHPPAPKSPLSSLQEACYLIPVRTTLVAPGGSQLIDILADAQRESVRANLFDHGLDLVFHHFFYWANGKRSIDAICQLIEDEVHMPTHSAFLPRTTSSRSIRRLPEQLDRTAVVELYRQLEELDLIQLTHVC